MLETIVKVYANVSCYLRRPNTVNVVRHLNKVQTRLFVRFREVFLKHHRCSSINTTSKSEESNIFTSYKRDTDISTKKSLETKLDLMSTYE